MLGLRRRREPQPDLGRDIVERFEREVEETQGWVQRLRSLQVEVGFDLNERHSDVAHLER